MQSTATAESQEQLAQHLAEVVLRFKLPDSPTGAVAPSVRAAKTPKPVDIGSSAIFVPQAKIRAARASRAITRDDAADWKEY